MSLLRVHCAFVVAVKWYGRSSNYSRDPCVLDVCMTTIHEVLKVVFIARHNYSMVHGVRETSEKGRRPVPRIDIELVRESDARRHFARRGGHDMIQTAGCEWKTSEHVETLATEPPSEQEIGKKCFHQTLHRLWSSRHKCV